MVPTSRPGPAILTDKAAGEEGPRTAASDSATHAARVSKLEYHTVVVGVTQLTVPTH